MEMHVRTDTIQFTVATETAGNVFSVVEFCRKICSHCLVKHAHQSEYAGVWGIKNNVGVKLTQDMSSLSIAGAMAEPPFDYCPDFLIDNPGNSGGGRQ